MPRKSSELRRFLEEQGVVPAETHYLEDYNPRDSPETVGLYISGSFFPVHKIMSFKNDVVRMLRQEKQRELELVAK